MENQYRKRDSELGCGLPAELAAGIALLLVLLAPSAVASEGDACKLLNGLETDNATVLITESVRNGELSVPRKSHGNLRPFCRVVAHATPSPQSNIVIEVWLPDGSLWNGRYLGTGNGGFRGAIPFDALAGGSNS